MHKDTNERYTHGHHSSVVDQHRRRTVEEAAAFLLPHIEPTMSILDLGCGPGSITIGLARQVPDGGVVGIDIVSDVLEQARELAIDTGTSNVSFNHGDLYSLDYPDNSFDVVYAYGVLMHVEDTAAAIDEMHRVLKPGGYFGLLVGDNVIRKVPVNTHVFLQHIAENIGFNTEHVGYDRIVARSLTPKRHETAGIIEVEWMLIFRKVGF